MGETNETTGTSWWHGRLHGVDSYPSHIHRKVFKELPDVVGCVDLFHFHLGIHIAMIHKVDIGHLHLRQTQIQMKKQLQLTERKREAASTSVMQSSCVTTRTTSSSGNREVHLISV